MRIETEGVAVNSDDLEDLVNNLSVSPNPASSIANISIETSFSGPAEIQIIDFSGKNVLNQNVRLSSGENNLTLDISQFAAGQYILNLNRDGKTKFVNFSIIKP